MDRTIQPGHRTAGDRFARPGGDQPASPSGRLFRLPFPAPFLPIWPACPVSEYIRRRRMSLAAADLQAGARVLDVALRCGYASPTAFNRAFRQVHGIPPSQARLPGAPLRSYPPIRLQIAVQGGTVLEFRVEKREAFPILGLSFPLRSHIEENFRIVPQMWEQAAAEGTLARLAAQMDGTPQGLLGVSLCQDSQPWRYYIAVASSQPPGPLGSLHRSSQHVGHFPRPGARPAASSSWKGASSQNGCPLPATNTPTRPTWRSTKTQTRATPSTRSGSLWPPSHKGAKPQERQTWRCFVFITGRQLPLNSRYPAGCPVGSCPFFFTCIPCFPSW